MRIELKEAAEFLKTHDDYLILTHASPDGDTLGSGYSLGRALQQLGKRVKVVCPDEVPHRFDYITAIVEPQQFEHKTIVCVDVADNKLLADMADIGNGADLCIDHHVSNTGYAQRLLLREEYAAAAELMYQLLVEMGVNIDKEIADSLYTGIATDTGCFKFSNTTPQTHIIAAELMKLGAEIAPINYTMFEMKTQGRIRLEQDVMKNIRFFGDGHIAVVTVMLETIASITDIDSDDVGAMAAIPRQIEGVDIGISIKEKKAGYFKVSLRSSELIDVAEIARGFGGGGHARASGCSFYCEYEQVLSQVVEACIEALRKQANIDV